MIISKIKINYKSNSIHTYILSINHYEKGVGIYYKTGVKLLNTLIENTFLNY